MTIAFRIRAAILLAPLLFAVFPISAQPPKNDGIAITLLTQLFTALVPFLVGAAAIAGSLASAFVALAWLSFSFQALLYGAAWVRVREDGRVAASARLGGPAAPAEPGGGGE